MISNETLERLSKIEDGWLNGHGLAPSVLDEVREGMKKCPEHIPDAAIWAPTFEGGIVGEWNGWNMPSLIIAPSSEGIFAILGYFADKEKKIYEEYYDLPQEWGKLFSALEKFFGKEANV